MRVCVFPREMVVKNRTSVFTLAIGERGQLKKRQKSPRARVRYTKELLIFVGTLRTSTFFYYMRARVSPSVLCYNALLLLLCVYVYVKVISIFSSLLLNDSRFHCVRTSVLFGVVQTLELVVFASEGTSP